jgi:hypothetical protein
LPAETLDPNFVLLLDFNGGVIEDNSPSGHEVFDKGDAKLSSTDKQWGDSSLKLDGSNDNLLLYDSDDWDIYSDVDDEWTIDFRVRHNDIPTIYNVDIQHYRQKNKQWVISRKRDKGLRFIITDSKGGGLSLPCGGEITDNECHHIALCNINNKYVQKKDG